MLCCKIIKIKYKKKKKNKLDLTDVCWLYEIKQKT